MTALLRKELRQLLPWIVLAIVSVLMEWLFAGVLGRIDEQHWISLNPDVMPGKAQPTAVTCVLLGLVIGMSLFPREYDEGTIHFLRGLPTSAARIFASKVLAGALFITCWLVVNAVSLWALQRFNDHSMLGRLFVLRTALVDAGLSVLACLCVMCHAIFLSFFRRFGLLLFALAWIGLEASQASRPQMAQYNPTTLLEYRYVLGVLVIPWEVIRLQVGAAAGSLLLGAAVWMIPAERITDLYAGIQQRWWGRAGQRIAPFAMASAVIGLIVAYNPDAFDEELPGLLDTPTVTAQLETHHYLFTYPADARSRMLALGRNADADYALVATALGVEDPPPIIADMTEVSGEHLGIAAGHKIKIALSGHSDPRETARTLVHETTHVLAYAASGDGLADAGESARMFNEGLAEYMQEAVYPQPGPLRHKVAAGALAWSRNHMLHSELTDATAFLKRHSEALLYPVGLLWAQAWASACGPGVFAQVLRAMRRVDSSQELAGAALWRDLSMRVGCGWGTVTARFDEQLRDAARVVPRSYLRLPAMVAHVEEADGDTFLVVGFDPPLSPADANPSLRVGVTLRADSTAGPSDVVQFVHQVVPNGEDEWEAEPQDAAVEPPQLDDAGGGGALSSDAGMHSRDAGMPVANRRPTASDAAPLSVRFYVPEHLVGSQFEYLLSVATEQTEFPLYGRWTRAFGN